MLLHPLRRRNRVPQRLLDDRVYEPRRQAGIQQLGFDQRIHRLRCRLAVDSRHLGRVGE